MQVEERHTRIVRIHACLCEHINTGIHKCIHIRLNRRVHPTNVPSLRAYIPRQEGGGVEGHTVQPDQCLHELKSDPGVVMHIYTYAYIHVYMCGFS